MRCSLRESLCTGIQIVRADGSDLVRCDEIICPDHSYNANITGSGFDIVIRDISKGEEGMYGYRTLDECVDLVFNRLCEQDKSYRSQVPACCVKRAENAGRQGSIGLKSKDSPQDVWKIGKMKKGKKR